MRIVCLSDSHLQHDFKVPDGDILLHAGDATWQGAISELVQFSDWFSSLPHATKIFTAGNHDILFETDPALATSLLDKNIIYLQDSLVEVEGLKIYGSPYQPEFGEGWAFNLSRIDGGLTEKWEQIPEGIDVLITHGPPLKVRDELPLRNEHIGCYDLLQRVQIVKPKLHVFGHIHCAYGTYDAPWGGTYVNASVCNEHYDPVNEPIVIDL